MTREEAVNLGKKLASGKKITHSIYQAPDGEFHVFCLQDVIAWVNVNGEVQEAQTTKPDPYDKTLLEAPLAPPSYVQTSETQGIFDPLIHIDL